MVLRIFGPIYILSRGKVDKHSIVSLFNNKQNHIPTDNDQCIFDAMGVNISTYDFPGVIADQLSWLDRELRCGREKKEKPSS